MKLVSDQSCCSDDCVQFLRRTLDSFAPGNFQSNLPLSVTISGSLIGNLDKAWSLIGQLLKSFPLICFPKIKKSPQNTGQILKYTPDPDKHLTSNPAMTK